MLEARDGFGDRGMHVEPVIAKLGKCKFQRAAQKESRRYHAGAPGVLDDDVIVGRDGALPAWMHEIVLVAQEGLAPLHVIRFADQRPGAPDLGKPVEDRTAAQGMEPMVLDIAR